MELFFVIVIIELVALNYEIYSVRNQVAKTIEALNRIHADLLTR